MINRPPAAILAVFVYICILLVFSIQVAISQTYNFYFGNLHSHSWYSDGNQDQDTATYKQPVAKAFQYGRTVANNLNWLAVTDHNHSLSLNMTMSRWRAGNAEADTANKDGIFVGFYGQEWGTLATGKGHSLVLGTNKLFGWQTGLYDVYVPQNDYSTANTSLWRKVLDNGGFIYLAHPSSDDFNNIAASSYSPMIDSVLKGVAVKSGKATSTNITQTDPSTSNYESFYHNLLKIGYHVAPTSDQDNHNTNFGMSNQQRTVVLATSLTRTNIVNALRNRNVYGSEDNNMQVKFEVGPHIMGDIYSYPSPFTIKVKVTDATSGDAVSSIQIRSGVPGSGTAPTTLASVTNVDSLVYIVNQTVGTTKYYYIYVLQADGQRAWTAPMWITAESPLAVTFGSFTGELNINGKGVVLNWTTITEMNNYGFHIQRKLEGDLSFETISPNVIPGAGTTTEPQSYSFIDTSLIQSGNYSYRIQQIDSNGLEHYSDVIVVNYNINSMGDKQIFPNQFKLYPSFPNPFNPSTNICFTVANSGFATLKVYNVLGKELTTLFTGNAEAGRLYKLNFDGLNLESGIYFSRLQSGGNLEIRKLILLK
jgi:trimeric autotransporter adhesin